MNGEHVAPRATHRPVSDIRPVGDIRRTFKYIAPWATHRPVGGTSPRVRHIAPLAALPFRAPPRWSQQKWLIARFGPALVQLNCCHQNCASCHAPSVLQRKPTVPPDMHRRVNPNKTVEHAFPASKNSTKLLGRKLWGMSQAVDLITTTVGLSLAPQRWSQHTC